MYKSRRGAIVAFHASLSGGIPPHHLIYTDVRFPPSLLQSARTPYLYIIIYLTLAASRNTAMATIKRHVPSAHDPEHSPLMGDRSVPKVKQQIECPQLWSSRPAGFLPVERYVHGTLAPDQILRQAARGYLGASFEL